MKCLTCKNSAVLLGSATNPWGTSVGMTFLIVITLCAVVLPLSAQTQSSNNSSSSNSAGAQPFTEFCWRNTHGRGAGKPLSTNSSDCGPGFEKDPNGLLCYPTCKPGYTGVGPVCWQTCPSSFSDNAADCGKPKSYGRGAGYALWDQGKCNKDNPQGCEQNGAMYYPKCKANFHAAGCCVCSPDCPSGMKDVGAMCQKDSYGRRCGRNFGVRQRIRQVWVALLSILWFQF